VAIIDYLHLWDLLEAVHLQHEQDRRMSCTGAGWQTAATARLPTSPPGSHRFSRSWTIIWKS
jgi:hypothetical protein